MKSVARLSFWAKILTCIAVGIEWVCIGTLGLVDFVITLWRKAFRGANYDSRY